MCIRDRLTGHHLDFMQWVLYLTSIITVIVYSVGLSSIYKPSVLSYSLILLTFTTDTLVTCFFTLWFSGQWFSAKNSELTDPNSTTLQSSAGNNSPSGNLISKRGDTLSSQSASQGTEYFFTILVTIFALATRFYFNFIIMAFVQRLLRHPKYVVDQDDVEQDLKHRGFLRRWWIRAETHSYKICRRYLA